MTTFAASIVRRALLTAEEERELARRRDDGSLPVEERRAARDELVIRNRALAYRVASKRAVVFARWAEDLHGEAELALVRAADHFDPDIARFSTYAWNTISKELWNFAHRLIPLISVPPPLQSELARIDLGVDHPGDDEALRRARAALGVSGLGCSRGWADEEAYLEESFAVPDRDLAVELDAAGLVRSLSGALGRIPPRLSSVVLRRAADETLGSIGVDMGVSKERIRQLEKRAIVELRKAMLAEGVADA